MHTNALLLCFVANLKLGRVDERLVKVWYSVRSILFTLVPDKAKSAKDPILREDKLHVSHLSLRWEDVPKPVLSDLSGQILHDYSRHLCPHLSSNSSEGRRLNEEREKWKMESGVLSQSTWKQTCSLVVGVACISSSPTSQVQATQDRTSNFLHVGGCLLCVEHVEHVEQSACAGVRILSPFSWVMNCYGNEMASRSSARASAARRLKLA